MAGGQGVSGRDWGRPGRGRARWGAGDSPLLHEQELFELLLGGEGAELVFEAALDVGHAGPELLLGRQLDPSGARVERGGVVAGDAVAQQRDFTLVVFVGAVPVPLIADFGALQGLTGLPPHLGAAELPLKVCGVPSQVEAADVSVDARLATAPDRTRRGRPPRGARRLQSQVIAGTTPAVGWDIASSGRHRPALAATSMIILKLAAFPSAVHAGRVSAVLCDASPVPLVWVTGTSGVGKSTFCALLNNRGELAVDADWEGYNHWVDRTSGQVVVDPPYPVPAGWLDRFAWRISRARVEALAARMRDKTAFLCGSVENEVDVRDLFDLVVCVVVDNETLRDRLLTRTTNTFGKHPEELAAALEHNDGVESTYRRLRATIIDGAKPSAEVADAILAGAGCMPATGGCADAR